MGSCWAGAAADGWAASETDMLQAQSQRGMQSSLRPPTAAPLAAPRCLMSSLALSRPRHSGCATAPPPNNLHTARDPPQQQQQQPQHDMHATATTSQLHNGDGIQAMCFASLNTSSAATRLACLAPRAHITAYSPEEIPLQRDASGPTYQHTRMLLPRIALTVHASRQHTAFASLQPHPVLPLQTATACCAQPHTSAHVLPATNKSATTRLPQPQRCHCGLFAVPATRSAATDPHLYIFHSCRACMLLRAAPPWPMRGFTSLFVLSSFQHGPLTPAPLTLVPAPHPRQYRRSHV